MSIVPRLQGKSVKGKGCRHIPRPCLPYPGITVTASLKITSLPNYAQGREEGRKEGRKQGKEEGREERWGGYHRGGEWRGGSKLLKHNFHDLENLTSNMIIYIKYIQYSFTSNIIYSHILLLVI